MPEPAPPTAPSSADTSAINPFGMKLEIERLKFDSMADTMRVRLRNASVGGALMRYNGEAVSRAWRFVWQWTGCFSARRSTRCRCARPRLT